MLRFFLRPKKRLSRAHRSLPAKPLALALLALTLLALIGCASTAEQAPQVKAAALRQADIGQYQDWQAQGRIALSSEQQAISGSLDWQQQGSDYAVRLTALFGQRALYVEQKANQATLQASGRDNTSGPSAEALLLKQLGIRVPLAQLGFWLRGLPGTVGRAQYDRYGRLHTIKYQDPDGRDWRARVKRYKPVDSHDLPQIIEVSGGAYEIRVVVSEWQLGTKGASNPAPADSKPPSRIAIPGAST